MSAADDYFKHRHKDPAKLGKLPKTKHVFDNLTQGDFDVLDKVGQALEDDLNHGDHVDAAGAAPATPEERLQTYIYAIH